MSFWSNLDWGSFAGGVVGAAGAFVAVIVADRRAEKRHRIEELERENREILNHKKVSMLIRSRLMLVSQLLLNAQKTGEFQPLIELNGFKGVPDTVAIDVLSSDAALKLFVEWDLLDQLRSSVQPYVGQPSHSVPAPVLNTINVRRLAIDELCSQMKLEER